MSSLKNFIKAIRHEYSQTAAIRISKKQESSNIVFYWKYKGTIHFLGMWNVRENDGTIYHADTNDEFQLDVAHYAQSNRLKR